jgi:alpha-galactosidase
MRLGSMPSRASPELLARSGTHDERPHRARAVHCPGQTDDQYRTEFAVWSITQSPLIVSTDVRNLTAVMRELILDAEVVAAHQSTATPPGALAASGGLQGTARLPPGSQVWARGVVVAGQASTLAAFVNWDVKQGAAALTATFAELGLHAGQAVAVRDLYAQANWPDLATDPLTVTVPPGGTIYLKLSAV